MNKFKTVAIISRRETKQHIGETLKRLSEFLELRQCTILVDKHSASVLTEKSYPVHNYESIGTLADLAIIVGGDGSMLTAARSLAKHQVPVVGINLGGLGFLNDIAPLELDVQLDKVFNDEYMLEERFLLAAEITCEGEQPDKASALNDIVLSSGQSARMIEFELYVDDHFVYTQRSNGLIVSTPTGSTAYALSGGGPIMHPNLDAIVLVPMFPHTLTARPIVIEGNSHIKIVSSHWRDAHPILSCDGHVHLTLSGGDEINIAKMPESLSLIHPLPHDFYQSCRNKLGWGSKLGI